MSSVGIALTADFVCEVERGRGEGSRQTFFGGRSVAKKKAAKKAVKKSAKKKGGKKKAAKKKK